MVSTTDVLCCSIAFIEGRNFQQLNIQLGSRANDEVSVGLHKPLEIVAQFLTNYTLPS